MNRSNPRQSSKSPLNRREPSHVMGTLTTRARTIKRQLTRLNSRKASKAQAASLRQRILRAFKGETDDASGSSQFELARGVCSQFHDAKRLALSLAELLGAAGEVSLARFILEHAADVGLIPKSGALRKSADRLFREFTLASKPRPSRKIDWPLDLLACLAVYESELPLKRTGSHFDGGYLMADVPGGYDCFLSGGVRNNIDFEISCCDTFGLKCIAFDPNVDDLPTSHPLVSLNRKAIGATNTAACTNLHQELAGHCDALVKLDIEGAEYDWIEALDTSSIAKIKQLVVEVHRPTFECSRLKALSKLCNTHVLLHVHGNNACGTSVIAGVHIPNTFECTFVRRADAGAVVPRDTPLPIALDAPNTPLRPQIRLAGWPFLAEGPAVDATNPKQAPSDTRPSTR